MAQMSIDELNSFDAEEYIEDYFKPMRISEDRKEERKEAAKDYRDILLFILALILMEYERDLLDWAYIQNQFKTELLQVSLRYAAESEAIQDYVNTKSDDFISITKEQDLSDPYWTSDMRATHEAVNEANDVIAISEMQRAEMLGAVSKRWKTEGDYKVRPTHKAVNGETIDIDEMFHVGADLMRFPHDWYYSAKESYNCRCGLDYLDEKGKVVLVGKMREEVNKTYNKVQYTNLQESGTLNVANIVVPNTTLVEQTNEKITGREREYILYSDGWGVASLSEAIRKFAPNALGKLLPQKGKIIYSGVQFNIVYDYIFDYFRIEDPLIRGKRRYLLMDGTNPTNITENGRTRGRTTLEYEIITHFKNGD